MERDFPVGHPAASDYAGEPYTPPRAPHGEDYEVGHPARGGKNVSPLDTQDGMRSAHLVQAQDLQELAMIGSLPPLIDPDTHEEIALTPQELAHVYAVRNAMSWEQAQAITDKYGLKPMTPPPAEPLPPPTTAEQQALQYIITKGYTPERARELLAKYGAPSVLLDREADAHR
jgi:hypothetical protein